MIGVAAIQHDIVWEDPDATMALVGPLIRSAVDDGARLVVLSEMWATGFSMNTDQIAQEPNGSIPTFMHDVAAEAGVWIAGSFAEQTAGFDRPTNRFVLAGPDGEDHRYSKVRPFTYGGENEHYDAGSVVHTFTIDGVRITPLICYDLRFANLFWDKATDTDCFVVPANWPASRREHWIALLRARAIENQAYVVGVNRIGSGGGLDYTGDSRIVDPMGETITAPSGQAAVITANIDEQQVRDVRTQFPFMNDR